MKASTEEFLLFLLWSAEALARPSWNNLQTSFEGWAFRNGLGRRLSSLQQKQLVEKNNHDDLRIVRLTEKGRTSACGGRDPEKLWGRAWEGRWQMVIFDVSNSAHRQKLRRLLRDAGFGWLQNSVWIAPILNPTTGEKLFSSRGNVESLVVMEGRPIGGETDTSIVRGAWDFDRINHAYSIYLKKLRPPPMLMRRDDEQLDTLRRWLKYERELWATAAEQDPFLPKSLWPTDYLGERAWQSRRATLSALGNSLSNL